MDTMLMKAFWIVPCVFNLQFVYGLTSDVKYKYKCPSRLTYYKQHVKILDKTCYEFVLHERKGFSNARLYCMGNGGDLAAIRSPEVNNFIADTLDNTYGVHTDLLWFGLQRKEDGVGYQWVDGSSLGNYSNIQYKYTEGQYRFAIDPKTKLWVGFRGGSSSLQYTKKMFVCEYAANKISIDTGRRTTLSPEANLMKSECPKRLPRDKSLQTFDVTCYTFETSAFVSAGLADRVCRSKGGQLATVNSKGLNDFIQNLLYDEFGFRFFDAWIGLNFFPNIGVHMWLDGTPYSYDNFRAHTFDRSDKCVAISPVDGKWVTKECSRTNLPFVCEYVPGLR